MSRLMRVVLSKAGHIEKPYSLDEILDKIESDDYNAELMLQHLLLHHVSERTNLLLYISKRENHAQCLISMANEHNAKGWGNE